MKFDKAGKIAGLVVSGRSPPFAESIASSPYTVLFMTTSANPSSRCERIEVNGLGCAVRHWGPPDAPILFMLHGRQDASPTFQFVVEALRKEWHVIAPDWRGHGQSEWQGRPYWIPDFCPDLLSLLDRYSPGQPARILGHSMGARIAALLGGARPERVAQLLMIDHLGLLPDYPLDAPTRMRAWIDAFAGAPQMRGYPDRQSLAARLVKANPRLTPVGAEFLAAEIGFQRSDGLFAMAFDPWLKVRPPVPYLPDEEMSLWRSIRAPVLHAISDEGFVQKRFGDDPAEFERRIACFATHTRVDIRQSGHNVQHDQPELLAEVIEDFFVR